MKHFQLLLLGVIALLPQFATGQNFIKGTVFSADSKRALAFAQVTLLSSQDVYLTDKNGTFKIPASDKRDSLKIVYRGFNKKLMRAQSGHEYLVQMNARRKTIADSSNVNQLLARASQKDQHWNSSSAAYSFNTYSKLFFDQARAVKTNRPNVDSTPHHYLSEEVSKVYYKQNRSFSKEVLGTKTAGFDSLVYQVLRKKLHSYSWYHKTYTIFEKEYVSPLGPKAETYYDFSIVGDKDSDRPAYLIQFKPKRPKVIPGLNGVLYIDKANYGLQKIYAVNRGATEFKLIENFEFRSKQQKWYPDNVNLKLTPGTGSERLNIYGGNISLGALPESKDDKKATIPKSLKIRTAYSDFKLDESDKSPQNHIQVSPKADKRNRDFWNEYRSFEFSKADELTDKRVDSLVKADGLKRKIEIRENFDNGYYPLGFFDVNLRYLIKVNNYEGLRPGFGGRTNEKFAKNFRLESYLKYGFKDEKFKYMFGAGFRLDKDQPTWLTAHYTKDLQEVGKYTYMTDVLGYTLFEPRLVNINFYYKYQMIDLDLQRQIKPGLNAELKVKRSKIEQTNTKAYSFETDDETYVDYNLSEAVFGIRWDPNSQYLKSDDRTIKVKDKYPIFSLQFTQAFDNVFDSDLNYTKIGGKIEYTMNHLNQSKTEFELEGDLGLGELPLTHAFHAYPNNPVKSKISKRFSVAGRKSFETMFFSEFFSSKLASLHIKHYFKPFDITDNIKPQLVLISRHAIGDMDNIERHQGFNFNTLDKGYSEAGFELNKIFWGFGLSFAYRYGAYHLPELKNNISFKFTYYMSI